MDQPAANTDETPVAGGAAEAVGAAQELPAESARPSDGAGDSRPTPARKPAARKSPSSPGTGPGRTTKRTPAKRPPVTLSAQVASGDFAISAPGAGKVDTGSRPASDAATTVVEAQPASDIVIPPLPELSPIDAALKFETMPDAPERRSLLDDQEPMRFVWSKRWPFLALVPESSVPARTAGEPRAETSEPAELATDAPDSEAVVAADATPQEPAQIESAQVAPAEYPPVLERTDDPDRTEEGPSTAQSDSTAHLEGTGQPDRTEELPAAERLETTDSVWDEPQPAPAAASEPASDPAVEPALSPALATTVIAAATSAPGPATVAEPDEPGPAAAGLSDGVDTARVNELLDEIEAAEDAEPSAVETTRVDPATSPVVLRISGLSRRFGDTIAVDGIDLDVHEGSFYGIVGPNGAGKTTTLSMVTGLLRPDAGSISVHGVDVWTDPDRAKRSIGVLPDRLRLFDRLTGAQLLYYSGILRGLDGGTVRSRVKDLAKAFGLEDALNRLVTDYSAGMTKKVALAAAMIHSPRLLVLDEPFESVDPVSAANVIEILQKYVAHGGTVVLSSHGMDLIQRVCDHVAIIVNGRVLASGAVDEVRGSGTLEDRFVELAGGRKAAEGMEWLHSFSD